MLSPPRARESSPKTMPTDRFAEGICALLDRSEICRSGGWGREGACAAMRGK